jgi:hypothetical protein
VKRRRVKEREARNRRGCWVGEGGKGKGGELWEGREGDLMYRGDGVDELALHQA